jgi:hypothetical protein
VTRGRSSFVARSALLAAAVPLLAALGAACSSSAPAEPEGTESAAGALSPSSGWSGCSGTYDTTRSPTGAYFVTDFGCASSPSFTDDSDNCCPSGVVQAAADGLCPAGVTTAGCTSDVGTASAVACERAVNWFSTGGTAFGLGTRLRLTRPDTGAAVVVLVIDNGPACYREQQFGGYALDISYPAILALYGEEEGVSDRATVQATVVPSSTPLGLAQGSSVAVDAGSGAALDASKPTPDAGAIADTGITTPAADASGVDAAQADTGAAADAGSAAMACASDGDCNPGSDGSGEYCKDGYCVAGCDADWECPGSTSCVAGICQ